MENQGRVEALDAQAFEQRLNQGGIVFVDFWARWCAPCRQFAPVFQRAAEQYPMISFVSIDVEKEAHLVELFQIRSIPHLMVFKSGIAIYSESGTVPESVLHELATQALDVDVSGVLKAIDDE
jgi:thioredoxin 1